MSLKNSEFAHHCFSMVGMVINPNSKGGSIPIIGISGQKRWGDHPPI